MDEPKPMRSGDGAGACMAPGSRATERMDWKVPDAGDSTRALRDAADEAVARALLARRHPVIEQYAEAREALSYDRGKIEGQREALRMILAQRGLAPDGRQRGSLEDCDDPGVLERWLRQAAVATHPDEIFFGRPGSGGLPGNLEEDDDDP